MNANLSSAADRILQGVVSGEAPVPGVVAIATDRNDNVYEGAAGKRMQGAGADMTPDTVFAIFSTTKAITGTACLQLVEDGKLDLDAPAKNYAPEIGKLQVLEGFDAQGNPQLRPPKRDVTTRMLLLHTAGFGYDFFNEKYNRLAQEHGQPSVITSSKASINTPLLFDPGDDWEYGCNIDWAGQVVEGISGKRLGAFMQERIFAPLGMTQLGLHADARDARAHGAAASARGGRQGQAHARLRAAAGSRGAHGRARPVFDGAGLLPLHPHVAERRHGTERAAC